MHFSILFTTFIAGALALPVPQVGTGLGDVLSGTAQGTNTLESGGANNAVNSAGASVGDVSSSAGDLITRRQVGTGLGDVLSGTAQGTNTLLSGGANNAVNSAGASVGDLSNSASSLINRSPEAQVGAGAGDVLSGTAQGTNTLESGGANNAVNSFGASVGDVSSSAGDLVN